MPTVSELHDTYNLWSAFKQKLVSQMEPQLIQSPDLAEEIDNFFDDLMGAMEQGTPGAPATNDDGLAELIGLGPSAAGSIGAVPQPTTVSAYDDSVTPERIRAMADLYYIYQHEKLGVFRTVLKLQELFNAGTVRLSAGPGAYGLYRYDRRRVLRYTQRDRAQAYRRVFGYTQTPPPPGARPNHEFHHLFVHFLTEVAEFFRDKRVSEVIRPRASDPSFGSIAVVRRAGLDLRNNVKDASYGHVAVMRVEVMQLLDEAFRILSQPDILKLFGSDNAWDVIEEVMRRYMNEPNIQASSRNRMATAGRDVLNWLADPYILKTGRAEFESLLLNIGDKAEEWVTSAESLGINYRRPKGETLPGIRRSPTAAPGRVLARNNGALAAEMAG